jgi:hypothetical protein
VAWLLVPLRKGCLGSLTSEGLVVVLSSCLEVLLLRSGLDFKRFGQSFNPTFSILDLGWIESFADHSTSEQGVVRS